MLVSCCCFKTPQFEWLETTQIYYPIVMDIRSLIREQDISRVAFLLENLFPCLFQFLGTAHVPRLPTLFHLRSQQSHHSNFHFTFPSLTLTHIPLSCEGPCACLGPIWIIPDNLPLSRSLTKSHLQIPSHKFWESGCEYV